MSDTEQDALIKETIEQCAQLVEIGTEPTFDPLLTDPYWRGRRDEAKEKAAALRRVANS